MSPAWRTTVYGDLMTRDLAEDARTLRALHRPGTPLVLPNVWDAASAGWVRDAGFPVLATASAAVSASLGYPDGEQVPVADFFAATLRIADRCALPITMDCESGYGLAAADLVARLTEAGAVGMNIEDTDHTAGGLREVDAQADRIAAIRSAATEIGVDVVINARIDVFFDHPAPDGDRLAEGIRRGRAYRAAGADCLYPIFLLDEGAIAEFIAGVDAPVNIVRHPDAPPTPRLAELGVARLSFGPGLFRTAEHAVKALLASLA